MTLVTNAGSEALAPKAFCLISQVWRAVDVPRLDDNLYGVKAWMWGANETVGRVEGQHGGDGDAEFVRVLVGGERGRVVGESQKPPRVGQLYTAASGRCDVSNDVRWRAEGVTSREVGAGTRATSGAVT